MDAKLSRAFWYGFLLILLGGIHPVRADADANVVTASTPKPRNPALDQELIDVVRDGRTEKVGKGDADKVAALLAQGADPNAKDANVSPGTSALVWALNFGKDDAAQLLIQHGADGSAVDSDGENAAWIASKIYFCPGALELLIKKGVAVSGVNKKGQSILVSLMATHAAVPGKRNYLNDRPWTDAEYHAWVQREQRTVQLLHAAGVNASLADANGQTPLALARQSRPELVPILEAAQNVPSPKSQVFEAPPH